MIGVETSVEVAFDAATNGAVIVDRSAIGRIEVTGADRIDLLHRLSTNDLAKAKRRQIVGTVFTTDKGRIVDYVHVLVRESSVLLFTSPQNESKFVQWIEKYTIMEDIKFAVVTDSTCMVSLIGPKAKEFVESVFGISLATNTFADIASDFGNATVVLRSEFQTESVDFITSIENRSHLLKKLQSDEFDVRQMNPGAYEMFRIARGIPSIGFELCDSYNPYEVGLRHAISFTKGCYIGQEVIARLDTYQKIQKSLFGILFNGSYELRSGAVVMHNGEAIGSLTSVSNEVIRGKAIGIGVLKKSAVNADDHVSVVSDGKNVEGIVRTFPMEL